jgi:ParB/RepB/Spo0J family partition protein
MAVQFSIEHKRTSEYRFYPEDITIKPDLNGRYEKPEIEWLITDILSHGQHTPVAIRNDGGIAVLVAGFSRWRAISEINKRGLAPVRMQIRCTYVQCSESEAFLINISENRFRNPTTPLDDAHNIKRLLNVYGMTEEQIAGVYFPTAKTEGELKAARKFVKDRVALISLSAEAEDAVRSGRVKESAATAIAKLSQAQQHEVLKKEGTIERKDLKPAAAPKAAKPLARDPELMRRITAVLEDVSAMLPDEEYGQYIEVDRMLLLNLHIYVEEIKPKSAVAA